MSGVMAMTAALFLALVSSNAYAQPSPAAPAHWTMELRGGLWLPTNNVIKQFFGLCCNPTGTIEGGYLFKSRYGVELGAGAFYSSGTARGAVSGTVSQDPFTLLLFPVTADFTFRGRFRPNQMVVPIVRGGPDMVYFRENDAGTVIKGLKWGMHGAVGAQFSLKQLSGSNSEFELGVRNVYITIEARYNWINSFGKKGLDLSGALTTLGLMFDF